MKLFGHESDDQRIELLQKVPVFQELSRKEILEVDELLHERAYETGETLFEEGDEGHGIFVILSGKVRTRSSLKILEAAVPEFGPGDLLGELVLFDQAPRAATAVALETTRVVALFQAELYSLLARNKNIGVKVLIEISKTLSRRVRQLLFHERTLPAV